jgi:hypothetical protein
MNNKDTQLLEEALSKVYIKEGSLEDWNGAQVSKEQSAGGLAAAFEAWFTENFPPERLKEKKMLWFAFQEGSKHHSSGNRHIDEPI